MKDLSIRTMHATLWVPPSTRAMLDIGCNVGELLASVRKHSPETALAGCDVNAAAVEIARRNLPDADLRVCGAAELPFPDEAFDCVTCIETLEHIPPPEWSRSLKEMRRVLKPGGRLVLRTPHAGLFGWLDTNNLRFRAPGLYRRILGRGRRDAGYAEGSSGVYWHHHFSRREILALVGDGWEVESTRFGGCFVFPLGDYLLWPFYRFRRRGGWVRRAIERVREMDYELDYGRASYGILLALKKT